MPAKRGSKYAGLGSSNGAKADPTDGVDPTVLGEFVLAVVGQGDACLFSATRDGGSIRVVLMSGEEKEPPEYLGGATLNSYCESVTQHIRKNFT